MGASERGRRQGADVWCPQHVHSVTGHSDCAGHSNSIVISLILRSITKDTFSGRQASVAVNV